MITNTEKIQDAMDEVKTRRDRREVYSGMTYEEGIINALNWVLGHDSDEDFEYADQKMANE